MSSAILCPECSSEKLIKNGLTPAKTQKYICSDCNHSFMHQPKKAGRKAINDGLSNQQRWNLRHPEVMRAASKKYRDSKRADKNV